MRLSQPLLVHTLFELLSVSLDELSFEFVKGAGQLDILMSCSIEIEPFVIHHL